MKKHTIASYMLLSAAWLIVLSVVQFTMAFILCCGGNIGALIIGMAYGFASFFAGLILAKLAEKIEFGFSY